MRIPKKALSLLIVLYSTVGNSAQVSTKPIVDYRFGLPSRYTNCDDIADHFDAILPKIETPARRADYRLQEEVADCVRITWDRLGVIPVTAIAAEERSRHSKNVNNDSGKKRYQDTKEQQSEQMDK